MPPTALVTVDADAVDDNAVVIVEAAAVVIDATVDDAAAYNPSNLHHKRHLLLKGRLPGERGAGMFEEV